MFRVVRLFKRNAEEVTPFLVSQSLSSFHDTIEMQLSQPVKASKQQSLGFIICFDINECTDSYVLPSDVIEIKCDFLSVSHQCV